MILDQIVEHKRQEVAQQRTRVPLDDLRAQAAAAPPPLDFLSALLAGPSVAVIAEIKRKSPSAGLIRTDFDVSAIARDYRSGGAAALSVLTDEHFFGGRLDDLAQAKTAAQLPVLRKDFIIDEYQIHEARAAQADAILLIVRILSPGRLNEYIALARELGLAALVETHDHAEIERAAAAGAAIIGINNRDLDTLAVDLGVTERLAKDIPADCVAVSESGIRSADDVQRLASAGIDAVLVGETLMKSRDLAGSARLLAQTPRRRRS